MRTQLGRGLSAVIASRTGDRARRRRLGAAAVVVLLVTAGATARAHAYVIEGQPWPGHLITYHNTSRADAGAVAAAARDWNHSGAHLRLVSVPAGRAEVTISKMPRGFTTTHLPGGHTINSDALGYATLGHTTRDAIGIAPSGARYHGAHVWLREVGAWHREYGIRARMSEGEMTRVAVHELGHVLGLGHQMRGCAVMEPSLGLDCTSVRRPWLGLCPDPLEPDDIRGAVALYGGHEPKGGLRLCSLFARPGRPRSVTARPPARSPGETALSWLSPAGITLPRRGYDEYSLSGPASIAQYRVRGSRHGCPRTGGSLVADGGTKPGETIHVRADLAPGAWCLAVQVGDDWGRWGLAATVKVTIAAPQHPPIAAFVAPEQPFVGAGAAFTDRSKPGSAPITQWHWSFGDGTASTVENPTHTYAAAGTYTVRLTVTDANGRSATTRQPVTVIAPVPPQAAFDAPSEVTAGDDVSFEDASIPGTSPIVSWAWSFGDGTASSDENPDHIYATPGTDTATLTVTAQDGRQSSTSETITVDPQDAQVIRNPRSWTVH